MAQRVRSFEERVLRDLEYYENRPEQEMYEIREQPPFHDKQQALEMVSSDFAVPARWID